MATNAQDKSPLPQQADAKLISHHFNKWSNDGRHVRASIPLYSREHCKSKKTIASPEWNHHESSSGNTTTEIKTLM
jgi:hypothetical protein